MRRYVRTTLIVSGLAVLFITGTVWFALSASEKPHYQTRITLPGMAGRGEYLVNLWVRPDPPRVGQATLEVQITSIVGTATKVTGVALGATGPSGEAAPPVDLEYRPEDDGREHVFRGQPTFLAAGDWQITALVNDGGRQIPARFVIKVER